MEREEQRPRRPQVFQTGLLGELTFEQRPEGMEIWGGGFQAERKHVKGPEFCLVKEEQEGLGAGAEHMRECGGAKVRKPSRATAR